MTIREEIEEILDSNTDENAEEINILNLIDELEEYVLFKLATRSRNHE